MSFIIPQNYRQRLLPETTEVAIKMVKDAFQQRLSQALNLRRVTAPLFVLQGTGINDDLNGVESPVEFPIACMGGRRAEVVHSLAKWKRLKLATYGIAPGYGIYTDMNAIRACEELDNLHSLYVDQWDWERVMADEERNLDYLRATVERIYDAIRATELDVYHHFPHITPRLPQHIHFIHSEELLRLYPHLSPAERETQAARKWGAIFLIGIGGKLSNGEPHDGRAPDYDDWSSPNADGYCGLNGDIIVWDSILQIPFELSSMGIRVNTQSLMAQLAERGCTHRAELYYHKKLLAGDLPQTIGGGVGQSRLCMFLLQKAHVGEVQASIWPPEQVRACEQAGILLM